MAYEDILGYVGDIKQRALQTVDQANAMARNTFDVILDQKILSDSVVTRPVYQITDPNYLSGELELATNIAVDIDPLAVTTQNRSVNIADIDDFAGSVLPFEPAFSITATNPPKLEIEDFVLKAIYEPFETTTHDNYVWQGSGAASLMTAIMSIVNTGGLGITGPYTQAIFDEDRERKLQTLNDALMLVASKTGAKGFRRATSMTAAQENELILKYQYDMEQLSRNIIKTVEEHMRNNIQVAIQNGNALEKMHMDFANAYDKLFVDMAIAAVNKYKALIEAEVSVFTAQVEVLKTNASLYKMQAEIDNLRVDAEVKAYGAKLDKYKTDIDKYRAYITGVDADLKNVSNSLDFEKTDIQRYTAELQEHQNKIAAYRAEIEAYNAKLAKDRQEEFKVGLRKDEFMLGLDEMKNVIGKLAQEVEFAKTSAELALKSATESGTIGVNAIAQSGKVVSELAKALTGSEINLNTRKLTS